MSLSAMKKSNSLDKLLGAAVQENKPLEKKSYVDERIWKPVMDKTGNGFAIINRHVCLEINYMINCLIRLFQTI